MSQMEPSDVGPAVGGNLRASDSDRDKVIAVLNTAYAEGRLTPDEHAERLDEAARARTFDDLICLTRDLVPLNPAAPVMPAQQQGSSLPAIDRSHPGAGPDNLIAIFGASSRKGAWRARRRIQSFAMFGGCDLDFTDAVFENDVIEISGGWIFGGLDVIVPEGVNVRDETVAVFGGTDVKGIAPAPGGPTIVIKGLCLFGGVDVKGPHRRRRRRDR